MKYSKTKKFVHALFLLLSGFLYGCTVDDADTDVPDGQERMVSFSVRVPGAGSPATYALTAQDENEVKTVEILLFSNGKYAYQPIYSSKIVTDGSDSRVKTFSVKMPDGTYDMVILANARESLAGALGSISMYEAKSSVLGKLLLSNNSKWNTTPGSGGYIPIPMWGEISGITVTDNMAGSTPVTLVRMVAKVDVSLSTEAKGKFDLESVSLYNYNNKGMIAPVDSYWSADQKKATAPSVPAGTAKPVNPADNPLVYNGEAITKEASRGVSCTGEIYTFEAEAGTEAGLASNTCLVIGGKYNGDSQTTYYRVDFANTVSGTTTYLPLLRNHQYKVTISDVEGSGTASAKDAFNSRPVNIKANVLQWDNPDITQIVFDGQYMLGVSAGALEFSKELRNAESEDNVLQVVTDYPQGWKVSKIVDGSDITVTWLSLSNTQGVQGAPVSTQLTMTANTGSTRTAYIHLSAGRLNCTVKVVQTDQAYLPPDDTPGTPGDTPEAGPISITDADGNEVSVLTFAAAALSVPAAQTINISWPEGARLYYTTMNATNPFTFSNRGGNSDPTTGYFLEAGSGPKSYSIRPSAAITTPNLNFDPFYERRCVITYMAVDAENVEVAQTALTIRQEVPNVLASTASSYHAFGSSCTFFVRSNTSWRIERVTLSDPDMLIYDPTDNLAVGATGGFNVAEGSPVTFTLFAKFVFSGSIRVDIASPDSPPAFPTTTVILDVSNNGFIPSMHKGWAGSNIYWDGDLEKLTFDDVGETDHKNYQGVYFQWGSLYGLDASGSSSTSWSTDRIVYKPKTDGSGYEAVTGYSWNSWPQFGNASISANRSRAYLYEITDASTGLGDICKYLSDKGWAPGSPAKKWRLPTANEFEGTYSSSGSYSDVSSSANSAAGTWQNGNAVGRTRNGVFFPAAGYRERSSGTLLDVGDYGSYWTSSPNGTYAYCIDISEAAVEYSNPSYRTFGQSVRCVQE